MFGITEYIALGLSGVLLTGGLYYKAEVAELELDLSKAKAKVIVCENNNKTLRGSIAQQNNAIKAMEVDLNASNYKWEHREPSIKYVDRWKTSFIDRNITIEGGKCEKDINLLNAIREYGF